MVPREELTDNRLYTVVLFFMPMPSISPVDVIKNSILDTQKKKTLKGGRSKLTRGQVYDILHIFKDAKNEEKNIRDTLSDAKLGLSEDDVSEIVSDLGSYPKMYE